MLQDKIQSWPKEWVATQNNDSLGWQVCITIHLKKENNAAKN